MTNRNLRNIIAGLTVLGVTTGLSLRCLPKHPQLG